MSFFHPFGALSDPQGTFALGIVADAQVCGLATTARWVGRCVETRWGAFDS